LSVVVGALNTGVDGLSIVASAPGPLRLGAVLSWTVRVWVALLVLPQPSVAVQVRVKV